jgi:peptidoglycan/LPS O-acetylase OafA/YrhL
MTDEQGIHPDAAPKGPAPAHIPVLDGFRGMAAMLVAIFHCWLMTDPPLGNSVLRSLLVSGGLGVDFFFVLSGFVLFLPVVRRGGSFGSLRTYARRRVARIAPAYYFAVLVQAALTPLLTQFASPFRSTGGLAVLASHLLFLQHETPKWLVRGLGFKGAVMGFGVNGSLWSLSIEVLFYAVLPLVAAFYFRRPLLGLLLGVGSALLVRVAAWNLPALAELAGAGGAIPVAAPRLAAQFPGYFAHFAFGMTAAFLYVRLWWARNAGTLRGVGAAQLMALGALLLAMIEYGSRETAAPSGPYERYLSDIVPAAAFATLITLSAVASRAGQWPMANPLARWLGDVSYGAFLWHFPLILLFSHTLGWVSERSDADFAGMVALVIPSSLFFGWLSRRFLEEPAIAWARRRESGPPPSG